MRRATPDDAEALHALMRAAFTPFRDQYTDACFDATIIDAPRFRRRMQEGPVWVLDSEGQAVGTVGAKVDDRGLYVRGMAVHPDARRQGVGRRLLDACVDYARDQGIDTLWLSTTTFLDASAALYETYGFRPAQGPADLRGTPLRSYELRLADLDALSP